MNIKLLLIAASLFMVGCGDATRTESAADFVARMEVEGNELSKEASAAYWVRSTYITSDTAILAAKAGERGLAFESAMVKQAKQYLGTDMDPDTTRAIELMLRGSSAPAPTRLPNIPRNSWTLGSWYGD